MRERAFALLALLMLLGCPKKEVKAPAPGEVTPTFFKAPEACNPTLIVPDDNIGTKLNENNAELLSEPTAFQWLTQNKLKVLIVVVTSEEQLQAHYQCGSFGSFPPSGINFERSRVYLLFIQHPSQDELKPLSTVKSEEKMLSTFEVLRISKDDDPATQVSLFPFLWPVEVRGMSLKFRFVKPEAQPAK